MKFVNFYHLIGVSAILFMFVVACCFNAKDNVLIVTGTGFLIFFLLGVILFLERIEKRIEKIATEIYKMKAANEYESGLKMNEQAALLVSLENINRMVNEMKQETKDMSLHEIKDQLDKIQGVIEDISVKNTQKP